jgi:threonine dehydratase
VPSDRARALDDHPHCRVEREIGLGLDVGQNAAIREANPSWMTSCNASFARRAKLRRSARLCAPRSLATDGRAGRHVADGLATRDTYPLTFPALREGLADFVAVSEAALAEPCAC